MRTPLRLRRKTLCLRIATRRQASSRQMRDCLDATCCDDVPDGQRCGRGTDEVERP